MFVRPERQWNRRKVIHQRHRVSIFGEVHGSQIKLAGLTCLHAYMRKLLRDVHGQFLLRLLPASRAQNSPKLPFPTTKGTKQKSFSAIPLRRSEEHTSELQSLR